MSSARKKKKAKFHRQKKRSQFVTVFKLSNMETECCKSEYCLCGLSHIYENSVEI